MLRSRDFFMSGVTALIAVSAVIILAWLGFQKIREESGPPCVGKITKTYTTTSTSGGFNNVPVTTSTKYKVAVTREDGSACERGLKKKVWLGVEPGQYIDAEGNVS